MAKFDFRILLETVEGKKTSYLSQSFVDTSVDLVLSASQVYNRITGSVSASYQNKMFFSGSTPLSSNDINSTKIFKNNTLLSASLSGSVDTGSIIFTALDTDYDRLLRYKFFGEKVCNTLGLPHSQWVYVDQLRLPADNEQNIFEGNVRANNLFVSDTLTMASDANINSDVPFLIDTGSDRHIKFIDERGFGTIPLIIGYDKDLDTYEISGSDDKNFNIGGVDKIFFADGTSQTTAGGGGGTPGGSNTQVQFNDGGSFGGDAGFTYDKDDNSITTINNITASGNISSSGNIISSQISASSHISSSGDITATNYFVKNGYKFLADNVRLVEDTIGKNLQVSNGGLKLDGNITASGNISASGTIFTENIQGSTPAIHQGISPANRTAGLTLAKDLDVRSHITASNNISASGGFHTFGGVLNVDEVRSVDQTTNKLILEDDQSLATNMVSLMSVNFVNIISDGNNNGTGKVRILDGNYDADSATEVAEFSPEAIEFHAPITASGDISASGIIIAEHLASTDDLVVTDQINAGRITSTGDNLLGNSSDDEQQLVGKIKFTGDVTASNNISASGTLISNEINTIGHITASGNISASRTGSFGKMTIGTATPAHAKTHLTVKGGEGGNAIAHFERTIGGTGTIKISANASEPQINFKADNDSERFAIGVERAGGSFVIASGSSIANKEIVVVTQDDKVGINTTTPGEALEVIGNISASGTIFASKLEVTEITSSIVSSSTNILIENITSSGDSIFGDTSADTHTFNGGIIAGNITASGNISASGTITSNGGSMIDNLIFATGKGVRFVDAGQGIIGDATSITIDGDDTVNIQADKLVDIKGGLTDGVNIDGNITASGNISASLTGSFGAVNLPTNARLSFNNNDLQIFSDGTNSFISEQGGSGNLKLLTSQIQIKNAADNENIIRGTNNGSVELFHNNSLKLETAVGGIEVTGNITASGNISASGIISSSKLHIKDDNLKFEVGVNTITSIHQSTGTHNSSDFLIIDKDNSDTRAALQVQGNNGSAEVLFAASSGKVGIGTTSPTKKLQVTGDISASGELKVQSNITASGDIRLAGDISMSAGKRVGFQPDQIGEGGDVGTTTTYNADSIQFHITDGEAVVIDNNRRVGIGNSNPAKPLTITGDISSSGDIFLEDNKGIQFGQTSENFISGSSNDIVIAAYDDIFFKGLNMGTEILHIRGGESIVEVTGTMEVSSHITASGNISASGNGSFTGTLRADGNVDFNGDLDVDGTTNLDDVDIDGTVNLADDVTIVQGKKIIFDSSDTFIQANTENPEDLEIAADEDIFLSPDDNLLIQHGTTTYATFDGDARTFTLNGALSLSQSSAGGIGTKFEAPTTALHTARFDSDRFRFWAGGSERLTILSASGHVGVGDSAPNQLLGVKGTNAQISIEEDDTEFLRLGVGESENDAIIGYHDDNFLRFGVYASPTDTSIDTHMTIGPSGNITASGNISASGTIVANELQDTSLTNNRVVHVGSNGVLTDTSGFSFSSDILSVRSITNVHSMTHITASENISASGTIQSTGNITTDGRLIIPANGKIATTGEGGGFLKGNGNEVQLGDHDGDSDSKVLKIGTSGLQPFQFSTGDNTGAVDITMTDDATDATGDTGALRVEGGASIAKKLFVGTNLHAGAITASGNISASGNLIGNKINLGTAGTGHISSSHSNLVGFETDSATNKAWQLFTGNTAGQLKLYKNNSEVIRLNANDGATSYINNGELAIGATSTINGATLGVTGNVSVSSRITASSHISSSGDITATNYFVKNGYKFLADNVRLVEDTIGKNLQVSNGGLKLDGNITASGNISASGASFEQSVDGGNALITIKNTNTDNGTDKGVGIEFKHCNTVGEQPAGAIIAGKENTYFAVGGVAVRDSDLRFFVSENGTDTERLRIMSTGNTGIGTTNPTTRLQVEGVISSSGGISGSGNISGFTSASFNYITASIIDLDDNTLRIGGESVNKTLIQNLKRGHSSVTLSPAGRIQKTTDVFVQGNISASGFISTQGAITASGDISASGHLYLGDDQRIFLDDDNDTFIESDSDDKIRFVAGNIQQVTIKNSNFGIGDPDPQDKLVVRGDISASGNYIGNRRFNKTSNTTVDHSGDIVYFGGTTSMDSGSIYHYKSDGTWELANADTAATSDGLLGVALGAASDTNGVLLRGTVTLDHDPGGVGDVLFLSGSGGNASSTAPALNNNVVRVVGYCLDASNGQIWFNPSSTFVEVSA